MSNAEELMTDVYNTLVRIRYPKITTTAAKNVESTILKGENRLSLLSWLLCEKSPMVALKLQKLKGPILEAELLKCYSEFGICSDKKLLLGNCSLEEQLPTLRLLLDFIKCIFIESSIEQNETISVDDILNVYVNEDQNPFTSNIEPRLTYSESIEYFDTLNKDLNEHVELSSNKFTDCERLSVNHTEENHLESDKEENENEPDRDSLFDAERKNFIEAFSAIGSWPMFNVKNVKDSLLSIDTEINDIHTNFSSLMQFLHAKEEILNANVPMEISKLNTRLSEIVENAVTHTEEAKSAYMDDY